MSRRRNRADRNARSFFEGGIFLFVALIGVTAIWWTNAGQLTTTYTLVMIPMSAVAVVCIIGGFTMLILSRIADLHALASALMRAVQRAHPAKTDHNGAGTPNGNELLSDTYMGDVADAFQLGRRFKGLQEPDDT